MTAKNLTNIIYLINSSSTCTKIFTGLTDLFTQFWNTKKEVELDKCSFLWVNVYQLIFISKYVCNTLCKFIIHLENLNSEIYICIHKHNLIFLFFRESLCCHKKNIFHNKFFQKPTKSNKIGPTYTNVSEDLSTIE